MPPHPHRGAQRPRVLELADEPDLAAGAHEVRRDLARRGGGDEALARHAAAARVGDRADEALREHDRLAEAAARLRNQVELARRRAGADVVGVGGGDAGDPAEEGGLVRRAGRRQVAVEHALAVGRVQLQPALRGDAEELVRAELDPPHLVHHRVLVRDLCERARGVAERDRRVADHDVRAVDERHVLSVRGEVVEEERGAGLDLGFGELRRHRAVRKVARPRPLHAPQQLRSRSDQRSPRQRRPSVSPAETRCSPSSSTKHRQTRRLLANTQPSAQPAVYLNNKNLDAHLVRFPRQVAKGSICRCTSDDGRLVQGLHHTSTRPTAAQRGEIRQTRGGGRGGGKAVLAKCPQLALTCANVTGEALAHRRRARRGSSREP